MSPAINPQQLQPLMARHLPQYRNKKPHYQAQMLSSLFELGLDKATRLLDVGGGTGIIAEAMAAYLPGARVVAIDPVDRFCRDLSVETQPYDGRTIPFGDGEFDAATLNNVMHHVPAGERVALLREIRRVVAGPVFIKDHIGGTFVADLQLTILDAIGNIPFGGMIKAWYLSQAQWNELAAKAGYKIGATGQPRLYRGNPMAAAFPNRLETTLRFDPV